MTNKNRSCSIFASCLTRGSHSALMVSSITKFAKLGEGLGPMERTWA